MQQMTLLLLLQFLQSIQLLPRCLTSLCSHHIVVCSHIKGNALPHITIIQLLNLFCNFHLLNISSGISNGFGVQLEVKMIGSKHVLYTIVNNVYFKAQRMIPRAYYDVLGMKNL